MLLIWKHLINTALRCFVPNTL